MDQHARLEMTRVKHLYTKPNHDRRERLLEGLAHFVVGAIREARNPDHAPFAAIARAAFREAIRKVDDQAKSCTKDRCRGSRYWTRAALQSALHAPDKAFGKRSGDDSESDLRVRGEHTVPVSRLAELLWNMTTPTVEEAKCILYRGCIVAMTERELVQVGNGRRSLDLSRPFDRYRGTGISDIFDLEVDDGGLPQLVWTAEGSCA